VRNKEIMRSRLNGAASLNSTMLGKTELYFTNVSVAARSATSKTICVESVPSPLQHKRWGHDHGRNHKSTRRSAGHTYYQRSIPFKLVSRVCRMLVPT
jgi:hypothetical protein